MKKISDKEELTEIQEFINLLPPVDGNLNPFSAFEQESVFHKLADADKELKLFNKNYGNIFYGKKNIDGLAVIPRKDSISTINTVPGNIQSFPFVTEALNEFLYRWKGYLNSGVIPDDNSFKFVPLSGFVDFETFYRDHMQLTYKSFIKYLQQDNLQDKIYDFDSFLKIFVKFCSIHCRTKPLTLSSFVPSKYCGHSMTGLSLTMRDTENSILKRKEFIADPKFDLFNETVNISGFILDKSEPWKMYFNIYNDRAKQKINKYKQSNYFYKDFFELANKYDIFLLQKYIYSFYNSFVDLNQNLILEKENCKKRKLERKKIELKHYKKILASKPNYKWTRFYLYLRLVENQKDVNQNQFNRIANETSRLFSSVDKEQALLYVEKAIRMYPRLGIKNRSFYF